MPDMYRHAGSWKSPKARHARHAGVWKPWQYAWVRRNGQWVQFFVNLAVNVQLTNFRDSGSGIIDQVADFKATVTGGSGNYTYSWNWITTGGGGWGEPNKQQGTGGPSTFRCQQTYNPNGMDLTYYSGYAYCTVTDTVTGATATGQSGSVLFNTNGFN